MDIWTNLGIWSSVILVLITLTIPFKETILFRIVEHTLLGVASGVATVKLLTTMYNLGFASALRGELTGIIAVILGITILFRISKKYAWVSTYGMSIIVGTGLGLSVRGSVDAEFIAQIQSTIATFGNAVTGYDYAMAILGAAILISVVYYFTFTTNKTGPLAYVDKFGRLMLMVGFGAMFAGAVMTRMNFFLSAAEYVFKSLGLIG